MPQHIVSADDQTRADLAELIDAVGLRLAARQAGLAPATLAILAAGGTVRPSSLIKARDGIAMWRRDRAAVARREARHG